MNRGVTMIGKTLVFLSLATSLVFTQNVCKISGSVIDGNSGEVLVGANVIIEGTSLGQASNADGN